MVLQSQFGTRCFIPSICKPAQFNYFKDYSVNLNESNDNWVLFN